MYRTPARAPYSPQCQLTPELRQLLQLHPQLRTVFADLQLPNCVCRSAIVKLRLQLDGVCNGDSDGDDDGDDVSATSASASTTTIATAELCLPNCVCNCDDDSNCASAAHPLDGLRAQTGRRLASANAQDSKLKTFANF
eukprot:CAMPEP_0183338086 /NCGR_PEP_ID=MMETSP0164_2-20130417/5505_1 /TAXON_ID=221442 /ORGANISM="Coccolithus pelagicus ssp braarudi, Strain PLY182g" /LENGTH=138 /DNA_ID=CAMNT_0025507879 /DNA_START=159 /DNA_END=576 /DNA_ORIENTATION=+